MSIHSLLDRRYLEALSASAGTVVSFNTQPKSEPWDTAQQHGASQLRDTVAVGYMQGADGKIKPLYSDSERFNSSREINAMLGEYDDTRVIREIPVTIAQLEKPEILEGKYYEKLPEALKRILETGSILITTGKALPIHPFPSANNLAAMLQTGKIINFIDILNINQKNPVRNTAPYQLLHTSFTVETDQGRSGVLIDEKTKKPITVEIEGREYLIEIKGCGMASGGFGKDTIRSGLPSIQGACTKTQARAEIENLDKEYSRSCLGAAALTGFYQGREIGYIVRLAPSTVRASYGGSSAFPEAVDAASEIAKAYAHLLIKQITCNQPYLMDSSAHHENILVWGGNNFSWTDYSDHQFLLSNDPKAVSPEIIKQLIAQVCQAHDEVPKVNTACFVNTLNALAEEQGINLDIKIGDDNKAVADKIWNAYLAERIFQLRVVQGFDFLPDSITDTVKSFSLEQWQQRKEQHLQVIQKLCQEFSEDSKVLVCLEKVAEAVSTGSFCKIEKYLQELHQIHRRCALSLKELYDDIDTAVLDVVACFGAEEELLDSLYAITKDKYYLGCKEQLQQAAEKVLTAFEDFADLQAKLIQEPAYLATLAQPQYYTRKA